jgi:hypothetical protein
MKRLHFQSPASVRRFCALLVLAGVAISVAAPSSAAQSQSEPSVATSQASDAYSTTMAYVEQFYPLWFTYYQFQFGAPLGATNSWVAAKEVTRSTISVLPSTTTRSTPASISIFAKSRLSSPSRTRLFSTQH